jgi:tRNA threonylcarbamoyladenosine biosynthesis protein TsaE
MMISSPQAMLQAGRAFAARLHAGDVVALHGELGAGKTLFCRGVLEGLGYRGDVQSPTYTITHHYSPPDVNIPVVHADLYRLKHADELDELGLFDDDAIHLVEWAGQGGGALINARFVVRIDHDGETQRILNVEERLNAN